MLVYTFARDKFQFNSGPLVLSFTEEMNYFVVALINQVRNGYVILHYGVNTLQENLSFTTLEVVGVLGCTFLGLSEMRHTL